MYEKISNVPTTETMEFSHRALLAGPLANVFAVVAPFAQLQLPPDFLAITAPTFVIAMVMKKRSWDAYQKIMPVLTEGRARGRGGESGKMLVSHISGPCSYYGIRAAYQDFYKDAWQEEFAKLMPSFSKTGRMLAEQDVSEYLKSRAVAEAAKQDQSPTASGEGGVI